MKKLALAIMLCLAISTTAQAKIITPKDLCSKAKEVCFNDRNSIDVYAQITKIKKGKKGKRTITVTCYGDIPQYDGHIYTITLTKGEYNDWVKEQGKVRKGDDVIIWLYKMETRKVTDDVVLNIRK